MCAKKLIKSKTKDRTTSEEKLLTAAAEVFSKQGFKGATTRQIAQKAGINLSLINRYFDGKYGLFIAMVEKKIYHQKDRLMDYPPQASVEKELTLYGEYYLKNIIQDKNLFKIVMGQFLTDSKFLKKFRNIIPTGVENPQFEKRLQDLIKKGKMTDKYSLAQIIEEIESFAVSFCLMKIIIHDKKENEAIKELKDFIGRYAQSLKPV